MDLSRVVFLVPEALYFGYDVVSDQFWELLCQRLLELGYIPFFNSSREIVPGIPHVIWDLKYVMILVEKCKRVIGVRTGLMDALAAFTDARMYVIYPDDDNPTWVDKPQYPGPDKSLAYIESGGSVSEKHRDEGVVEFVHTEDEADIDLILNDLFGEQI